MERRSRLVAATLAGLAVGLVWLRTRAPNEPERPTDLFLISVDTLRADRLGFMGYEAARTPRIDALAAAGASLTQAITPMPRTTPGLASLHTGLWPHHHGSREVGDPILAGVRLAELLRDRGYRTLAVSANATAGPLQGLDRGFDRFVTYEELIARQGADLYRDLTAAPASATGWAAATTTAALELLAGVDETTPVFLWVFYFDPHFQYRPPSPWQDGVEASDCWELYAWGETDLSRGGAVFYDRGGVAARARDHCGALYDAEVAYTDHEIGRLIDGFDERRRLDAALTVFTADHGENLGESGLFFEHGDNLHDAGLRVPLVFRGPGVSAGARSRASASLVDVGPTVLGLLDVPRAGGFGADGADLSELLRSAETAARRAPEPAGRVVFAESATAMYLEATDRLVTGRRGGRVCLNGPRHTLCEEQRSEAGTLRLYDRETDPQLLVDRAADRPQVFARLRAAWRRWPPESARLIAARTPRFKLIRTPRLEGGYAERLIDLVTDPAEEIDVSADEPAITARLRAALDGWAAGLEPIGERSPDPDVERALRALGYVR